MRPTELLTAVTSLAEIKQPFFIWGDPGVGKSQIVQQAADKLFAAGQDWSLRQDGSLVKGKKHLSPHAS